MKERDEFVHRKNLEHYRKLLAELKDEAQRQTLMKLLADEEAKETPKQGGLGRIPELQSR